MEHKTSALSEPGFTLLEVLAALVLFGLMAAGMGPMFVQQLQHNHRSDITTEAMGAAQIILDRIRTQDPATLPTTGTGASQAVAVGTRSFTVTPSFCENVSFCTSSTLRHVKVRVYYGTKEVFHTQTVYTQLR